MKTTIEEAREKSHENLVSNLQGLLEKNYDAEQGYKEAMVKAENGHLKEYLKVRAALRNRFATELSDIIINLNEKPIESGSATGAVHRTWMNIKDAFSSDSDESILEECIRGEKASVEEYKEVLRENENHFTPEITSLITNQMLEVEKSLDTIKKLEDLM